MTEEEIENLLKKLSYCEDEYLQNGYLSVGKFDAIKQAIKLIENQQEEIKNLKSTISVANKLEDEIKKRFIPKSKIEEKIKILENEFDEIIEEEIENRNFVLEAILSNKIMILEELLESED